MAWSQAAAVAVLVALTSLPDQCRPLILSTGPGRKGADLVSSNPRPVTPDLMKIKEALGMGLVANMYLDAPVISPEQSMPPWGSPARDARPAFSHVHSVFEAGQKGPLLGQNGEWIRHQNATMVLSYHTGCPVQLYRIADEGELHTEILGDPLEAPQFRPTSILWPGVLVTMESLCEDRATLASFVTVPAWSPQLRETLEPAKMAVEYPQHAQLINRLASPGFNADRSPLFQTNENGDAE